MFLLLQFIGAAFIVLGVWFVFGKLLRKDTAMVMGLCAVGILSAALWSASYYNSHAGRNCIY